MTLFESISVVLGLSAMVLSIFAIGKSRTANTMAKEAMKQNEQLAQKANFFELVNTVNDLSGINKDSLIGPDITKMANALDVISLAWENQSVDRKTIYRMVGDLFKRNYEIFKLNMSGVPGYSNEVTLDSLLKDYHEKTYSEIKNFVP